MISLSFCFQIYTGPQYLTRILDGFSKKLDPVEEPQFTSESFPPKTPSYMNILSWPPSPSNSHPQDDITCLGSGIPINLHVATITGKGANPICIYLNIYTYIINIYIAQIYLLYVYIGVYMYLKTIYVLQLTHIVYTIIKTSHDFHHFISCFPRQRKRPHLRRRDQTLLPYQRSQPLKISRGVSHGVSWFP